MIIAVSSALTVSNSFQREDSEMRNNGYGIKALYRLCRRDRRVVSEIPIVDRVLLNDVVNSCYFYLSLCQDSSCARTQSRVWPRPVALTKGARAGELLPT